jgi:O-succinylbenzoate synthase
MNEWISVKDRLPSHHQLVIARNEHLRECECIFVDNEEMNKVLIKVGIVGEMKKGGDFCHPAKDGRTMNNVTHWMPLPEPPK